MKEKIQRFISIEKECYRLLKQDARLLETYDDAFIIEIKEYINNKYFIYLNNDVVLEKINEISEIIEKWYDSRSNARFHKKDDFKSSFSSLLSMNEPFDILISKFDNGVNVTIKDYLTFVIFDSLIESNIKETMDIIDEESFSTIYNKKTIIYDIIKNLEKNIFLLALATNTEINLNNLFYSICDIMLYIEREDALEKKTRTFKANGRYKIPNERKKNNSDKHYEYVTFVPKVDIKLFVDAKLNRYKLSVSRTKPSLILNTLVRSSSIQFKSYILIMNSYSEWSMVFDSNKLYNASLDTGEKKNVKQSVENEDLKKTIEMDCNTRAYINKDQYVVNVNLWALDSGLTENLESDIPHLYGLIYELKKFNSSSSVKHINNLIVLVNYIKFYKTYMCCEYVYFKFKYDFRGRKYYPSVVSPTNQRIARTWWYYGYFSEEELRNLIKKSYETQSMGKVKHLVDKYEKEFEGICSNRYFIHKSNEERVYKISILVTLFISLGFIHKSKLLKECKTSAINGDSFFEFGLRVYKLKLCGKLDTKLELEDRINQKKIIDFIENGFDFHKKETISKDFSCSVYQLRHLITGFVDEENYKRINIDGIFTWECYYSFLINNFSLFLRDYLKNPDKYDSIESIKKYVKKRNKENPKHFNDLKNNPDKFLSILTRRVLKKSLMTFPYSVSFKGFLDYFIDALKEDDAGYKQEESMTIVIALLYKYLENIGDSGLLKAKKKLDDVYCEAKKQGYVVKLLDGFRLACAKYLYAEKTERITLMGRGKSRKFSLVSTIVSNMIDEKKSISSFRANYIHSIDGLILRLVNTSNGNNYSYLAIHDCFIIDIQSTFMFIDNVNRIAHLNLDTINQAPLIIKNTKWFNFFIIC